MIRPKPVHFDPTADNLNESSEVNRFNTQPSIRHRLRIVAEYFLAVSPLSSSFLVESFNPSGQVASWAHALLPLLLGTLGFSVGITQVRQGNAWIGVGQLIVTFTALIWAYLIAGFAVAVSHGNGI